MAEQNNEAPAKDGAAPNSKEAAKPKDPAQLKKILLLVFLVLNLAITGAGGFMAYMGTLGAHRVPLTEDSERKKLEESKDLASEESLMYHMDKFVVNLDGLPKHTILLEVSLEMLDPDGFEEVIGLGPEARDSIIRIINSKTIVDMETIQSKLYLKDQIATSVNGFLKKGVVKNVYFNQFVIQ